MEFKSFKKRMQEFLAQLVDGQSTLFKVEMPKGMLWDAYINSFDNPAIKQEHNCNCCRSFINKYGNIVAIIDGKVTPIWGFEVEEPYTKGVALMNQLVSEAKINAVFTSKFNKLGVNSNVKLIEGGKSITWEHMYCELPNRFINPSTKSDAAVIGMYNSNRASFKLALEEITHEALNVALELISTDSLYRGTEFKGMVEAFKAAKTQFDESPNQENFTWQACVSLPPFITTIRSKAIGTFLKDVSGGRAVEVACQRYQSLMQGYKMTSAPVTQTKAVNFEARIKELGLEQSLFRRFSTTTDVNINDVIYVDRAVKQEMNIFNRMKDATAIVNPKDYDKMEEIHINDFLSKVVPTTNSMEVLLENRHSGNLVALMSELHAEAPNMFKWGNTKCWYYSGGLADAMKERVKAAGGNVEGVLRFSLQWNEKGEASNCDLDLHVVMPGKSYGEVRSKIYFGNPRLNGGELDVDIRYPGERIAVENVIFTSTKSMSKGKYKLYIDNFNAGNNSGFVTQVEFGGQIYYSYYKQKLTGHVLVAEVEFDGENFKFHPIIESTTSDENLKSTTKWGLETNKFHKVNMIMNSPNFWESSGSGIGNKHWFFMLEGAKCDDAKPRGFFNEFLKDEYMQDRHAFDWVANNLPVERVENELAGVGFSSTQRNFIIIKTEGALKRTFKVTF